MQNDDAKIKYTFFLESSEFVFYSAHILQHINELYTYECGVVFTGKYYTGKLRRKEGVWEGVASI